MILADLLIRFFINFAVDGTLSNMRRKIKNIRGKHVY